jgi:hypothetical protein
MRRGARALLLSPGIRSSSAPRRAPHARSGRPAAAPGRGPLATAPSAIASVSSSPQAPLSRLLQDRYVVAKAYHVVLTYSGDDNTEPSSTAVDVTVAAPTSTFTSAPSTQPPAPSTQPSAPTNVTASRLNAMTAPLAAALRPRGFAALTTTAETLAAPVPGLLEQKIYSPSAPKSATTAAARKPVLIASGSVRFTKAGRATLRLRLTRAGRTAIRHAKALKWTDPPRLSLTWRAVSSRRCRGHRGASGRAYRAWSRRGCRRRGRRRALRAVSAGREWCRSGRGRRRCLRAQRVDSRGRFGM